MQLPVNQYIVSWSKWSKFYVLWLRVNKHDKTCSQNNGQFPFILCRSLFAYETKTRIRSFSIKLKHRDDVSERVIYSLEIAIVLYDYMRTAPVRCMFGWLVARESQIPAGIKTVTMTKFVFAAYIWKEPFAIKLE